MNNYGENIRNAIILLGLFSAPLSMQIASANDQIRLNPEYKGPTSSNSILNSDEIITEDLNDDFNKYLSTAMGDGQFILLTEPKDGKRQIISLNSIRGSKSPILEINQEYKYTPSLSFDLPDTSFSLGDTDNGLFPNQVGGSQVVFSLNPSKTKNDPFSSDNTLTLRLGSSFILSSANRYTMFLNNGLFGKQAYNLSFGVDYSGFQLGGSYSRNNYLFSSNLSGYDFGFGYSGESWSANFRVGEYSRNRSLLLSSDYNVFDNISAYELGAAYRLFANVNLTGRFTYYSYGFGNNVLPIEDVKSLIFGTNVSF